MDKLFFKNVRGHYTLEWLVVLINSETKIIHIKMAYLCLRISNLSGNEIILFQIIMIRSYPQLLLGIAPYFI